MEIYRIKKGILAGENKIVPIDFGIIESFNGELFLELYVNEIFDLENFSENRTFHYWNFEFTLTCLTEDNHKLEIDRLHFIKLQPSIYKIKLESYGKMIHTKVKDKLLSVEDDLDGDLIYYIELEGLKLEFIDFTEKKHLRNGKSVDDVFDMERDHTSVILKSDNKEYDLTFFKSSDSDNIIVEGTRGTTNHYLSYSHFTEIKRNFISLLSLINGAEVRIRKECTGTYYSIGKTDAEIVIVYSFLNVKNVRYNKYIPLTNLPNRSINIVHMLLNDCFENYKDWNQKLDLEAIIFHIINSQQTKSIEERVYTQIIAFERLSTYYAEYLGDKEVFLPSKDDYLPIKEELILIIEKYKDCFGDAYHTVKGKISNLNQIKRLSTTDKMFKIIHDVGLPVTEDIEELINILRHKTIHHGDIGQGRQIEINFYLLNELLAEIILRLIDYRGPRNSVVLLKKKE